MDEYANPAATRLFSFFFDQPSRQMHCRSPAGGFPCDHEDLDALEAAIVANFPKI